MIELLLQKNTQNETIIEQHAILRQKKLDYHYDSTEEDFP